MRYNAGMPECRNAGIDFLQRAVHVNLQKCDAGFLMGVVGAANVQNCTDSSAWLAAVQETRQKG
ncbi:MAG: hypothetical protein IJM64_05920 [Ottowia sp.]|nr:hypothetical protein [Ottowia sp.]